MSIKVKDFENGFKLFLQKCEDDVCELAVVIASLGISVGVSMDIARKVYKAGWRKVKEDETAAH